MYLLWVVRRRVSIRDPPVLHVNVKMLFQKISLLKKRLRNEWLPYSCTSLNSSWFVDVDTICSYPDVFLTDSLTDRRLLLTLSRGGWAAAFSGCNFSCSSDENSQYPPRWRENRVQRTLGLMAVLHHEGVRMAASLTGSGWLRKQLVSIRAGRQKDGKRWLVQMNLALCYSDTHLSSFADPCSPFVERIHPSPMAVVSFEEQQPVQGVDLASDVQIERLKLFFYYT